jgi:acyl-coenzyme A thioesterase PaaI-like protein
MDNKIDLRKAQRELFWFGLIKIPLIFFCRPKLIALDYERVLVRIPFRRRTKNHLGSMYFGALAVGADIAGGFLAFNIARQKKYKMSLAFKSFDAQFLKRPEKDVYFESVAGAQVIAMLEESKKTGERQNKMIEINAYCIEEGKNETVATFNLELSLKVLM